MDESVFGWVGEELVEDSRAAVTENGVRSEREDGCHLSFERLGDRPHAIDASTNSMEPLRFQSPVDRAGLHPERNEL
jgi:hypothetical protein